MYFAFKSSIYLMWRAAVTGVKLTESCFKITIGVTNFYISKGSEQMHKPSGVVVVYHNFWDSPVKF